MGHLITLATYVLTLAISYYQSIIAETVMKYVES